MPGLQMMITDAGLAAIVDAQQGGTEAILIEEIGLSDTPFVMAPTLTALPGEFRRLDTIGGQAVAENVIHVVAYDPATVTYSATGLGLYDGDGTLIAVHSAAADPILSKAELATSLFAIDVTLAADIAAVIEFGDALFYNPPATETFAGVVEISDNDEADQGANDSTAMSPKKVKRVLDATRLQLEAAIAAVVKPGFIIMWSGAIADIPQGWRLCDGTNGTPDLRSRFILGAGSTYGVGAFGGSTQHNHGGKTDGHALTIAEMPSHDHPNGVADQIATAFVYGSIPAATTNNMNNDSDAGTLQGLTGPRGGGGEHDHGLADSNHLPPYFALAFIMKV